MRHTEPLLNRKTNCATVPPLKRRDGTWCFERTEKANLLANTFQSKCRLPPGDWRPERKENRHAAMSDFHLTSVISKIVERVIVSILTLSWTVREHTAWSNGLFGRSDPVGTLSHCWYFVGSGRLITALRFAFFYRISAGRSTSSIATSS